MLLLSISIWVVLVYSLRVFLTGNPAYGLVKTAPTLVLQQASDCLESEILPENDSIILFIKTFFRLTALACVVFVVELITVFYFVYHEPQLIIPWFILSKNMFMLWLGYNLHRRSSENIFDSVLNIPDWAMRWERISYFVTAVCFFYLFLLVNDFIA